MKKKTLSLKKHNLSQMIIGNCGNVDLTKSKGIHSKNIKDIH